MYVNISLPPVSQYISPPLHPPPPPPLYVNRSLTPPPPPGNVRQQITVPCSSTDLCPMYDNRSLTHPHVRQQISTPSPCTSTYLCGVRAAPGEQQRLGARVESVSGCVTRSRVCLAAGVDFPPSTASVSVLAYLSPIIRSYRVILRRYDYR